MAKEESLASEFRIERSISIAASDVTVFELISDLRNWERWNPNGRGDSSIKRTYGGATSGTGAIATWRGRRSGAGNMEITRATPSSEIIVVVNFDRPFRVRNLNRFKLSQDGTATIVTWSMCGPKPLLAKLLGLIINLDRFMAAHFDDGLAALKAIAEA
jgi:hypothetical protein